MTVAFTARCTNISTTTTTIIITTTTTTTTTYRKHIARVTKIFDQGRGVVDSVKIFLSSRLITMQTLVAVCHAVCA